VAFESSLPATLVCRLVERIQHGKDPVGVVEHGGCPLAKDLDLPAVLRNIPVLQPSHCILGRAEGFFFPEVITHNRATGMPDGPDLLIFIEYIKTTGIICVHQK